MVKLVMCIVFCVVASGYSMDTPATSQGSNFSSVVQAECKKSIAGHIINEKCRVVKQQNFGKRYDAVCRIYATEEHGGQRCCYKHKGMDGGCLNFIAGECRARAYGNEVEIRHEDKQKLHSISVIRTKRPIVSYAFNADGSVIAVVSDQELVVCDAKYSKCGAEPQVRMERLLHGVKHVALSDSGNKVTVGIEGAAHGFRIMVIDVQKKQLLYDLKGSFSVGNFRFFYMMGEDIIATCFIPKCIQYDIGAPERVFARLTEEARDLLYLLYEQSVKLKKRTFIPSNGKMAACYKTLPDEIKSWVFTIAYVPF